MYLISLSQIIRNKRLWIIITILQKLTERIRWRNILSIKYNREKTIDTITRTHRIRVTYRWIKKFN